MARQRDYDEDDDRDDRGDRKERRRPRRDRDDEPEPIEEGGSTAAKVVAIIGVVFLAVVLIGGGIFYFSSAKKGVTKTKEMLAEEAAKSKQLSETSDKLQSCRFANSFLVALSGNRRDEAYQMTSAAYQKRVTQQEFDDQVEKFAAPLRARGSVFHANPRDSHVGTTYTYKVRTLTEGNWHDTTVTAVKDGNDWKVDQFTVEKAKLP